MNFKYIYIAQFHQRVIKEVRCVISMQRHTSVFQTNILILFAIVVINFLRGIFCDAVSHLSSSGALSFFIAVEEEMKVHKYQIYLSRL